MLRIKGLQKLTLLDYPGRLACTVFLAGCDLRCPFCHNAGLVIPGRAGEAGGAISRGELMDFLKKRRGVLDGVCVTGGEPLMTPETPELIRDIRALGYSVKLDTNGTFPGVLRALVSDGLVDYVAMDIKNQLPRYAATVGVPGLDTHPVEESAAFLLSGRVDYEFRTTVVKELHSREDFENIGVWLRGAKRYFLQGFVDSGDLVGSGSLHAASKDEMQRFADAVRPFVPSVELRGV